MALRCRDRIEEGPMGCDWCELRSFGQERRQRLIAEADAYRLARRAEQARPALRQTLGAFLRRLAARRAPPFATG
jgi:hypothetical protein